MAWRIALGGGSRRYCPVVEFEFIDPETGEEADSFAYYRLYSDRLKDGKPLSNFDDWPKEGVLTRPRKKLPPLWEIAGQFCGQQGFVDLIEEFEPGVHEWLPVHFRSKRSGELYPEQFYILNICQRLKSVVTDHPSVRTKTLASGQYFWTQKTGKVPIVLDKKAIEGKHLWRDEGGTGWIFASNEFVEALEKRFPKGWSKLGQRYPPPSPSLEEI